MSQVHYEQRLLVKPGDVAELAAIGAGIAAQSLVESFGPKHGPLIAFSDYCTDPKFNYHAYVTYIMPSWRIGLASGLSRPFVPGAFQTDDQATAALVRSIAGFSPAQDRIGTPGRLLVVAHQVPQYEGGPFRRYPLRLDRTNSPA